MQEDMQKKGEQEVNSGWVIQRDEGDGGAWGGLLCGPSVHLTGHLGNTASRLVQAQEDYIWRGIRFLKTKGCVFRSLQISPLRFFLLQSCKCFHPGCWEGVSNFLPSISGWFPVCRGLLIVCVLRVWKRVCSGENEGKNVLVYTCLNVQVYAQVCLCFTCCEVAPQRGDLGLQGFFVLRSVLSQGLLVSLPCSDMKTISLTADLTTAPKDKCQALGVQDRWLWQSLY